jgi:hypothetical protein
VFRFEPTVLFGVFIYILALGWMGFRFSGVFFFKKIICIEQEAGVDQLLSLPKSMNRFFK